MAHSGLFGWNRLRGHPAWWSFARLVTVLAFVLTGAFGAGVSAGVLGLHPLSGPSARVGALGPSTATTSTLVLYDNGVSPAFHDGSYGLASSNPCDTSTFVSAPCSYAVAYGNWGGVNFQVPSGTISASPDTTLQFQVNLQGQPLSHFAALFVSPSGSGIHAVILSDQLLVGRSGDWLHVSVPVASLDPDRKPIAAVQLKNQLDSTLPTVYFDDVQLVGAVQWNAASAVPSAPTPTAQPSSPRRLALLPGQQRWKQGTSSFLFGSNDSEEWGTDNVQTDPHHIIQSSMKAAHATLERTFIFHYSLADGHRTTIGTHPWKRLYPRLAHEYDQPAPPPGVHTGPGFEVEKRVRTIQNMGMTCLVVFKDIWTTPTHNADPNPFHKRIIDPSTGAPETDLDFAKKVVAYLGPRCNLYEIGNEPDLDEYTQNGLKISHMDIGTYVERWTEFVRALKKINPKAKFIGPVTYSDTGNDCAYTSGKPFPTSASGDCYMRNFLHGVRGTNFEPDAVSFHWYPCWNATESTCTAAQWGSYARVIAEVRGWIQHDLGHIVPLGITEWNFDPGGNTTLAANETFMEQYTRAALSSMIGAKLDFANQYDTQSIAGYGALDMFDVNHDDQPKKIFAVLKDIVQHYRPVPARATVGQ